MCARRSHDHEDAIFPKLKFGNVRKMALRRRRPRVEDEDRAVDRFCSEVAFKRLVDGHAVDLRVSCHETAARA